MKTKLHVAYDEDGYYIADEDNVEYLNATFTTRFYAEERIKALLAELEQARHAASTIDGYYRDDLGESPDF